MRLGRTVGGLPGGGGSGRISSGSDEGVPTGSEVSTFGSEGAGSGGRGTGGGMASARGAAWGGTGEMTGVGAAGDSGGGWGVEGPSVGSGAARRPSRGGSNTIATNAGSSDIGGIRRPAGSRARSIRARRWRRPEARMSHTSRRRAAKRAAAVRGRRPDRMAECGAPRCDGHDAPSPRPCKPRRLSVSLSPDRPMRALYICKHPDREMIPVGCQ